MKTSELIGPTLDLAVANPGKVSRYMSVMERIHRQSSPRPNGCRIWNGKKNQHGYGMVKIAKKSHRAHRVVFYALHPKVDRDLVIRHKCDNPACVNPHHLVAGTVRENMMDMVNRGRHRGGAPKGNQNAVGNKGWMKGGITAKYTGEQNED